MGILEVRWEREREGWTVGGGKEGGKGTEKLTLTVGPEAWIIDMKSASWCGVLVAVLTALGWEGPEGVCRVESYC